VYFCTIIIFSLNKDNTLMKNKQISEFRSFRTKMNERILASENVSMKRLFSLDTITYQDGALDAKTKEMLGLCASLVLRCDDCVKYHLEKCKELDITTPQIFDIFAVGSVVGGTITIPHIRRAVDYWEALEENIV
jgi:AhpD family alkylhydroperoxidase